MEREGENTWRQGLSRSKIRSAIKEAAAMEEVIPHLLKPRAVEGGKAEPNRPDVLGARRAVGQRGTVQARPPRDPLLGQRLQPVDRIAQLCRERGVPLIVDASQSAGTLHVDMAGWGARTPPGFSPPGWRRGAG